MAENSAQVEVALNTALLQAKGLSPSDIVNAIGNQNIILPSGTAKIGPYEYDVELNAAPLTIAELNDLPVRRWATRNSTSATSLPSPTDFRRRRTSSGSTARAALLLTVLKHGDASTLNIVKGVYDQLPSIRQEVPPESQHPASGGPVHLRPRRHQRRPARGHHRRLPHRPDDPDLPRQLAQHDHHRGFHPAVDSASRSACSAHSAKPSTS